MAQTDFPIDYQIDVEPWSDEYLQEIETRLLDLAGDHHDMVGAAVAVTNVTHDTTPHLIHARVVVYSRPEYIAGVEESDTVHGAIKGALDAVERQVREKRKKLGEPWKRADLPGAPGSDTPEEGPDYSESGPDQPGSGTNTPFTQS